MEVDGDGIGTDTVILELSGNFYKFGEITIRMGTAELKTNLLRILEETDDEQLLRTIYDFIKQSEKLEEGQIWKTLTEEQKRQVYASYEESEQDANLKSWGEVKKKY
jgi:hypothetical protein